MPAKAKATTTAEKKRSNGFTAEERAAMKERTREMKTARSGGADGESEVLAKIAEMPDADRTKAERVHAIVKETAPDLTSRTWYGMPAYAKDDKVVFFFKPASKFKARYATLGFSDKANLDEGGMWPTEFAVHKLTATEEQRIRELVERAVS